MALWAPPPPPTSKLARHRPLAPSAGIHVSPLQLGAMSIGDKWDVWGMGAMDKTTSFALLDAFYAAGGNFVDTANHYQDESSEAFIGEWMQARGVREHMVVATKYSSHYKRGRTDIHQHSGYVGNNLKSLRVSLDESLKKLRTDYVDILYVHWWDYTCSIEEVMDGLHNIVAAGKALYLGISDTPAWIVSSANRYARDHGKTPFVIYQGEWNVLKRDFERDVIPMARHEGMALAPWYVLAGGRIMSDADEERRRQTGEGGRLLFGPDWERNETERKVAKALEEVAAQVGAKSVQAVAIAYVMQKTPYVFPILGGRKPEHLHANIEALDVALSDEHIKHIESASPFEPGFPIDRWGDGSDYPFLFKTAGTFDRWPRAPVLRPEPKQ
ncbi:aryl-alcohol dehydrogenase [Trametes meyenii]|nr:aryl-alcohol dehydrogenase [Trametes meyenii]